MTDIVERLRSQDPNGLSILLSIQEAADEIERLRAALTDILKHFKQYEDAECCKRVYAQARRALEPKP